MILLTDTREQLPLEFPKVHSIEYAHEALAVGDYGAMHGSQRDQTVFERKSVPDLFGSFTAGYEQERNKLLKAKELGLRYILAIESTASDILKGHCYFKDGELYEHKKSGLAMLRQLMTIQRKYGIQVWCCASRREMAWMIQEYFLAHERVKESRDAHLESAFVAAGSSAAQVLV